MLNKYGKSTPFLGVGRGGGGQGRFCVTLVFYILGAILIKQLFHLRLLDMR